MGSSATPIISRLGEGTFPIEGVQRLRAPVAALDGGYEDFGKIPPVDGIKLILYVKIRKGHTRKVMPTGDAIKGADGRIAAGSKS
jgi:hypothetical protein